MPVNVITLDDASFGYGAEPVVRNASLQVERGTVTVVLGENGSGKSTLVKGVLGLVPRVSGSAQLFGQDATAAARRRVGYVPQPNTVAGGVPVTVRELVTSGRAATRRPFAPLRADERAAVDAALDAVRLRDRAYDPVATLSGGQQRRALIARALAGRPEVLIMDEPTAGIDAANVDLLTDALGHWKRGGLTLVVVAHGAGPLRPLVDLAVVMAGGRITYQGPLTAELDATYDDHVLEDHRGGTGGPSGAADSPVAPWPTEQP